MRATQSNASAALPMIAVSGTSARDRAAPSGLQRAGARIVSQCIGKTGLWRRSNVATPVGGLLGSRADEGRAKLRYYSGKAHGAIEPEITEWDFLSYRTFALAKGNLLN